MQKDNNPTDRLDLYVLWITAGFSVLISVLDFLGLLDEVPWLAQRIPTLMLLVGGIIVGYLAWERRKQFDALHHEVDEGIERILSAVGGEVKIHRGRQQFLAYITECIASASDRIDATSLSPGRTRLHGQQPDDEIVSAYESAIEKAVRERAVRLRRVRVVSTLERFEPIEQELTKFAGLPLFSAVYLRPGSQMPVFNIMIVDDQVVIGGINKSQSHEVMSITTKHPLLREIVIDYFNELWSKSISLNERSGQSDEILQDLRREMMPGIEFINGMDEMWSRSAEIVAGTQQRLWVTACNVSTRRYESEAKNKYNEAFQKLVLSSSDIELRRVVRVDSKEQLEYYLELAQGYLNRNNFLLNCIVGGSPMIDVFLRDKDILMLGLQHQATSMTHDAVVLIRDPDFIAIVKNWYERFLWAQSIPVKDKAGIKDEGIARVQELLDEEDRKQNGK